MPGPVMTFFPVVPKVNGAGAANAAVLNHCCGVLGPVFGLPTRSGRLSPVLPVLALSNDIPASTGVPVWYVVTPDTCHPPAYRPLNGRSSTELTPSRLRRPEMPFAPPGP